jgi:chloramphenicol 3-O-phosphotransferase
MFPRRAQPVLDRWVAGALSETEFLRASGWREVWQRDPQLYLPIFHFARMNGIALFALNVDRKLTRAVGQKGFDAIPVRDREGISRPAAPSAPYVEFQHAIYVEHGRDERARAAAKDSALDDPAFRHFVESQLVWDRAMAQGIAAALARKPAPLVVGVMGGGHIANRYGVPHQLASLDIHDVAVLLPWDGGSDCARLITGYADAVFGVTEPAAPARQRQRLGVSLELVAAGVRIGRVEAGSVAEAAGLRTGDIVIEVAGLPAKQPGDVADAVQRHAAGTWLPLKVKRDADAIELVAKFPPLEQ